MFKCINYIVLFLILTSCIKNNSQGFGPTVEISPAYSIPVGNFSMNINGYLSGLFAATGAIPDSLFYNDTLLPNTSPFVQRTETYPINFNSITTNFNDVKLLMIRFIFYNGYPTSFTASIHLQDAGGNTILTLPESVDITVPSAATDNNLVVTEIRKYVQDIEVPENLIPSLQNVSFITTDYYISTSVPGIEKSKFYDYYQIIMHVGARFQLTISM